MNAGKVTKIMDVYSNSHNFRDTKKPENYSTNKLNTQPFGFFRVLWGFIVLLLNIVTIFLMKNKLDNFAETVFLLLLLLFALIILKGWKNNAGWAWPAMIIFLSMALANNVYIFVVTKNITVFISLIILNVWSIVLSMLWSLDLPSKELVEKKEYELLMPEKSVRRGKQR